jgi:hypothetical protein
VVVVGGHTKSDLFTSTVEIFNFDTKKWRSAGRIINTVNFIDVIFIYFTSILSDYLDVLKIPNNSKTRYDKVN